ncbi:sterol desaturase family protein [uncultured Caulobacter sp.]|uniref:sterol desaturase family protein n=1 Tax=uncultured Caulobacter sp. TaxID=158749 RepID=UPI00260D337D|nr:sterol desaturase family protein [uncultured Caulobacter sp.]
MTTAKTGIDLATAGHRLVAPLLDALLPLGSTFSLVSLACALLIAAGHIVLSRRARGRETSPRLLLRALFPRKVWLTASSRADLVFCVFNLWVAGVLLSGALLSGEAIAVGLASALRQTFGAGPWNGAPWSLVAVVGTVLGFLAYELAYWFDHWLSHKVPLLWAFHKVHHTAEALTPLTVYRVHPIESLKFANLLALATGGVGGVLAWAFGPAWHAPQVFGQNAIFLVFVMTVIHLQHSHAWMTFAPFGRWLLSPAHHQIHHSADPAHFGKNLGSCLAVWDRMFGTLHVPGARPRDLRFGALADDPHSLTGGFATPFVEAVRGERIPAGVPLLAE